MEAITLRQLMEAVGGTLLGEYDNLDQTVAAVDTDSRSIRPGSLFVPLEGERFDGHSFISAALDAGAAGCLTAKVRPTQPGKFYVKVRSTQRALGDLACWYRKRFSVPVVAVTGSVGKTTTKDMVAAVLGEKYRVLKTEGNFNNNIGLPLTLLGLDKTTQVCVLEMGMNHAGEIDYLGGIAEPDVALITNIGDCHIEFLGSRQGIFQAKCEIFSHMKPGGTAILNGDDALLSTLRGKLNLHTLLVGTGEGLDYTASQLGSDKAGHMVCTVNTPSAQFRASVPALGEHMVYPALMAAAVGELFGLTGEEIARGIGNFLPTKMRMNVVRLPGGVTLLNDAYNANPQSMRAAAAVLRDVSGSRKVAIVGDMLELGENSADFHRAVGASFGELGTDCLIAVGDLAGELAEGAREGGVGQVFYFPRQEQAMPTILAQLEPGAVLLVKASRSMHFERIVEGLTAGAGQG